MSRRTPRSSAVTFIIEAHRLASSYLEAVLAQDSSIQALCPEQAGRMRPEKDSRVVFLIDTHGLLPTLCQCLRTLRFSYPEARFIILAEKTSPPELHCLLWLGIHGFVAYPDVEEQLTSAVHAVYEGKFWIEREILDDYLESSRAASNSALAGRDTLTRREYEILELVKRRLSNQEVAQILNIRISTVKSHVSSIFAKLQSSGRHELIREHESAGRWWKELSTGAQG